MMYWIDSSKHAWKSNIKACSVSKTAHSNIASPQTTLKSHNNITVKFRDLDYRSFLRK